MQTTVTAVYGPGKSKLKVGDILQDDSCINQDCLRHSETFALQVHAQVVDHLTRISMHKRSCSRLRKLKIVCMEATRDRVLYRM